MKLFYLTLFIALFSSTTFAQSLKVEKGDFSTALSKAEAQKKPLCILLIPSEKVPVPTGMVNLWKDKRITNILNADFVNYAPSSKDSNAAYIRKRYPVERSPLILFVNGSGDLIYRFFPNIRNADSLISKLSIAKQKSASENSLAWYTREYKNGNRDTAFLKAYIAERESLGIYFNHMLLQDYAEQLTIKDINTIPVTAYLLHTGMVYGSPLYEVVNSKRSVKDSAWASFPLKERSQINRRIILNTFQEAVKRKNAVLGQKAAEYQRNISAKSGYAYSQYVYNNALIQYYRAVKDTVQILSTLRYHIERTYSKITADTLNKYRKLYPEYIRELKEEDQEKPPLYDPEISKLVRNRAYAGLIARAPMELNNYAWLVYLYSKSNDFLIKALTWSKQAVALDPKPEYYDTMAHLLYRMDIYFEAEQMQLKAIELAELNKRDSKKYKTELAKIKNRTL